MQRSQASDNMTSREWFQEVMRFGQPDRVTYFEEGIRDEVIDTWRRQGLTGRRELEREFPSDVRENVGLDLDPRPGLKRWPSTRKDMDTFRRHLDPKDPERLPRQWENRVRGWKHRNHVLMLYVHQGFFLGMGVGDWGRFYEVMTQLVDSPRLVRDMMMVQGELAATLTGKALKDVAIDAAIFSEPIGGNEGPLISPGGGR